MVGVEMPLIPRQKEGKQISDVEVDATIGDCPNLDNLRRVVTNVRQETLNILDSLSKSDLAEEATYCGGWFGSLQLPVLPER